MALLVENSAVIMAKGRRNSSAEVGNFLKKLVAVFETFLGYGFAASVASVSLHTLATGALRRWLAGGRIL